MNADGNVVLTSKALNDNRSLNIDTTHTTTATAIKYSKSCLQMNSGYFTHGYSVSLDFNESLGNSLDFDRLHELELTEEPCNKRICSQPGRYSEQIVIFIIIS
jgi:hypothetical protein